MKPLITFFFLILSFLVYGQTPDTSSARIEIDSLFKLHKELLKEKNYTDALVVMQESEKICLESFGEETEMYTKVLQKFGFTYYLKKDYKNTEPIWLKVNMLKERVLGMEHPDYINSLDFLGLLYRKTKQYEKSEEYYLQVKAIRGTVLGKEHIDYALVLYSLGNLYKDMGQYEKAEFPYLESKNVFEKNEKLLKHPYYLHCLNNLGNLYYFMGHYDKAEHIYLKHKSLQENRLGRDHRYFALSLNNLGDLYSNMGQYNKAEEYFLEAIEIRAKLLGKEHPRYAGTLINLGTMYSRMEEYDKQEKYYLEAKKIFESNENLLEHPYYLNCLSNLSVLYSDRKQYDKVEEYRLKVQKIREKTYGKEHPKYASSLRQLGNLYAFKGEYKKAEKHYFESIDIVEKALGKEHEDYTINLYNIGWLYWLMGQFEKAELFLNESYEIKRKLLLNATNHLSERELLNYSKTFREDQSKLLSFTNSQKNISGIAFDNSLFYKGFLLNANQQVSRLARTDSISTGLLLELKKYRRKLSKAYSNSLAERDSIIIVQMEDKANIIEKELTKTVAGFGRVYEQVDWKEVQSFLKPTEAAIEFVSYNFSNPNPTDSIKYAALLLQPGDEQPHLIPLFLEESLKTLLSFHQERRSDYVNDLYSTEDRGVVVLNQASKNLFELIWKPIEAQLEGVTKIYFSPSGLLHRINLGAIALNEEVSLCDKYNLVQVNSTRQLVIPHLSSSNTLDALLMGGIEYNVDSLSHSSSDLEMQKTMASVDELSILNSESKSRGGSWNYLKYTQKEVSNIDAMLSDSEYLSEVYFRNDASEENFRLYGKNETSPRFIHLATHGFFFPYPDEHLNINSTLAREDPIFKMSDHPMIRSGLILAGGNHVWQGNSSLPGKEDGILTAYEISQMDLSNTELVVLSACETGLGDIEGNEGVYGLQRAFKIAGVKYLIMSLWQVPDRETKDFMVTFYKHLLNEKMTIPEAFRTTQKEMKERFYNPYQWAGFVLVE